MKKKGKKNKNYHDKWGKFGYKLKRWWKGKVGGTETGEREKKKILEGGKGKIWEENNRIENWEKNEKSMKLTLGIIFFFFLISFQIG